MSVSFTGVKITDGFGVEGLRNRVFSILTSQTGTKEALVGVKMNSETEVTLLEYLDSTQLTKSSERGVTSRLRQPMKQKRKELERRPTQADMEIKNKSQAHHQTHAASPPQQLST
ncbi:hypothetical protein L2E82_26575 [Cichorium intybus]|uniref:Uncharacterized protein n=1 Tax=Cichorium intybus TaxID=13427 RepID=A0ACB9CQR3_CICIN|nr:hypothetical protein L2E82_26575 [Cichorium intybus]